MFWRNELAEIKNKTELKQIEQQIERDCSKLNEFSIPLKQNWSGMEFN